MQMITPINFPTHMSDEEEDEKEDNVNNDDKEVQIITAINFPTHMSVTIWEEIPSLCDPKIKKKEYGCTEHKYITFCEPKHKVHG